MPAASPASSKQAPSGSPVEPEVSLTSAVPGGGTVGEPPSARPPPASSHRPRPSARLAGPARDCAVDQPARGPAARQSSSFCSRPPPPSMPTKATPSRRKSQEKGAEGRAVAGGDPHRQAVARRRSAAPAPRTRRRGRRNAGAESSPRDHNASWSPRSRRCRSRLSRKKLMGGGCYSNRAWQGKCVATAGILIIQPVISLRRTVCSPSPPGLFFVFSGSAAIAAAAAPAPPEPAARPAGLHRAFSDPLQTYELRPASPAGCSTSGRKLGGSAEEQEEHVPATTCCKSELSDLAASRAAADFLAKLLPRAKNRGQRRNPRHHHPARHRGHHLVRHRRPAHRSARRLPPQARRGHGQGRARGNRARPPAW